MEVRVVCDDPLARAAIEMLLAREGIAIDDEAEVTVVDAATSALPREGAFVALVADRASAADALRAGARGVLHRGIDATALARALLAVSSDLLVVDPDLVTLTPALRRDAPDDLTPREHEVLQLLAGGLSNKEIASRLAISDHTVKFHVNALLVKLGAEGRTDAVVRGVRRGLVIL